MYQPITFIRNLQKASMVRTRSTFWFEVDKLTREMVVAIHYDSTAPIGELDCGGSGQVTDGCVRPIAVRYWWVEGGLDDDQE